LPSTIEQIQQELTKAAKPDGLAIVAISIQEPRETVRRWVDAHLVSFTVLLDADGRATADYGVTATPTVFLVARDGTLRGKILGTKPWTSATGRALLEALGRS
jgi:peroxiredoxin